VGEGRNRKWEKDGIGSGRRKEKEVGKGWNRK